MSKTKIYLGRTKDEIKDQAFRRAPDDLFITGEKIWFEKHSWDCDWYWGFGYIGNDRLHCHADIFTEKLLWFEAQEVFDDCLFDSENSFWAFKDLLVQAYALKKAAEVYRNGGYCTTVEGLTNVIIDKAMEERINADLKKVLDTLWDFLTKLDEKRTRLKNERKKRDSSMP